MTEFLDSIGYGELDPPRAGPAPAGRAWSPVLLGPRAAAKRTALVVTVARVRALARALVGARPVAGTLQLVSEHAVDPALGHLATASGIDGISLVMVLLTTLLMPLSVLASWQLHHQAASAASTR